MKYRNKCIVCGREAAKKYRGRFFCDDCYKKAKRAKSSQSDKPDEIYVERAQADRRLLADMEFFYKIKEIGNLANSCKDQGRTSLLVHPYMDEIL